MKEQTKTIIANGVTIGGVTLALGIAGLPIWASSVILVGTAVGCAYLTGKRGE